MRGESKRPISELASALQQYPVLTYVSVKSQQRSSVVPVLAAKQQAVNSNTLHKKPQKLAACTSLLVTQAKTEKSANL